MKSTVMALVAVGLLASSCNAITRGSKLTDMPVTSKQFVLSTGSVNAKYRTLGFLQIRGYGVEFAGVAQLGDAQLDGTVKRTLVNEATAMGGNGVINIEFLDENPSTDYEKAQSAMQSMSNVMQGGQVTQKERYITVTGEVIQLQD